MYVTEAQFRARYPDVAPAFETQFVRLAGRVTGGTLALEALGDTTSALAATAAASAAQAAIEALDSVGSGNVSASLGPLPDLIRIVFTGDLAGEAAPRLTAVSSLTGDDVAVLISNPIGELLEAASAFVDSSLGETFASASGLASARTFPGSGTSFLRVDPFVGTLAEDAVAFPSGRTPPAYTLRSGILVTTDAAGDRSEFIVWPYGTLVTITARWGYASAPADVQEAVHLLAIAAWRETYAAAREGSWRGTVGVDFAVPPRAAKIIDTRLRASAMGGRG